MLMEKARPWSGCMTKSLLKTQWPTLLQHAIAAMETLPSDAFWTWGGGTALSIHLDHRISYDIDIFLENPEHLKLLHPARNNVIKDLTHDIQCPGHYMKLLFEVGEIDFLLDSLRTSPGFTRENIAGHDISIETIEEVLVKKLHFRGSKAIARDVFDVEAARQFARASFEVAVTTEPESSLRFADTIRRKEFRLNKELPQAVDPTEKGKTLLGTDVLDLASEIEELAQQKMGRV